MEFLPRLTDLGDSGFCFMTLLQPTWESILVLGAATTLVGLLGLVVRPRKGHWLSWRAQAGIGALVLVAATAMATVGVPQMIWLPALALLSACGLLGLLAQPALRSGLLLLLGPALIVWQTHNDSLPTTFNPEDLFGPMPPEVTLSEEPAAWALTDAGARVPLYTATPAAGEAAIDAAREALYLQHRDLMLSVIRTGDLGLKTNCHGWVFSGGRYWVKGSDVDRILKENSYERVSAPQAGDVAIYRDENGRPYHTGLVRSVAEDGTIIQESKWGALGRFLHTADRNPYSGYVCTYHRSPRAGHCLKDL